MLAGPCMCRKPSFATHADRLRPRLRRPTAPQSLGLQRDALRAAGVDDAVNLYHDLASGVRDDRPGLDSCLRALRKGDVLVVWKLDRLGRNLAHLVNTVQDLSVRGVGLQVLAGAGAQTDTTTAAGPDELAFERTTAVAASTSSSATVSNRTSVCRSSPPPRRGRALLRTPAGRTPGRSAGSTPGSDSRGLEDATPRRLLRAVCERGRDPRHPSAAGRRTRWGICG